MRKKAYNYLIIVLLFVGVLFSVGMLDLLTWLFIVRLHVRLVSRLSVVVQLKLCVVWLVFWWFVGWWSCVVGLVRSM